MHRLVMKAPKGTEIDHVNGNTLDNRKSNLRFCTHSQNSGNQPKHHKTPWPYKGIRGPRGKHKRWEAHCANVHLGFFPTAEEAALAYNEAAKKRWGTFARLNDVWL